MAGYSGNFWFFIDTDPSLKIYTPPMKSDKTRVELPLSNALQEGGLEADFIVFLIYDPLPLCSS